MSWMSGLELSVDIIRVDGDKISRAENASQIKENRLTPHCHFGLPTSCLFSPSPS